MDNSRELARLLRKAQEIRIAKSRPPLWMITGIYRDEPAPEPPVEVFGTIIFRCDSSRPPGNTGIPVGTLCPLS